MRRRETSAPLGALVRPPLAKRCAACVVCGAAIEESRQRLTRTCESADCRVRERLEAQRPAVRAEVQRLAQQRATELAERDRARERALRAERDGRAAHAGITDPSAVPVGFVPFNDAELTNLPASRVRAFRHRLTRVISDAVSARTADTPPRPDDAERFPALSPRAQREACSLCRGWCCRAGAEHAYQDVESVRALRAAHPELRPMQMLELYLTRLPAKSYRDSCVYHAEGGCALPRDLRSVTCNRHLCIDLRKLGAALAETGSARAFLGATRDGEPVVSAFVG